jgi:hypothetical protein
MVVSESQTVGYAVWVAVPMATSGVVSTTPKFEPYKVIGRPPSVASLTLEREDNLGGS